MRMVRTLAAICAALAIVAAPYTAARGAESEGFTITDDKLVHKKDFGPLPVPNPSATVADPTLQDCKDLPSDNAVKIEFKIKSTVPVKSIFTVTWTPESNDTDVYFFDEEGALLSDAATASHPERFQVAGLPNGVYYVCVRNFGPGATAGFTLEVKANFVELYKRPPEPPTPKPSDAPPAKMTTPEPTAAPTPPPAPTATPEPVDTPGPDGTVKPQELFAVSGERQAGEPDEGRSALQIGLFVLTGAIVAAGAGLVALRIRRDTAA